MTTKTLSHCVSDLRRWRSLETTELVLLPRIGHHDVFDGLMNIDVGSCEGAKKSVTA